jgi:prevent-host-death family protein
MEVNIHEAKTRLSRLIEKALTGEDIVIAKAGRWRKSPSSPHPL